MERLLPLGSRPWRIAARVTRGTEDRSVLRALLQGAKFQARDFVPGGPPPLGRWGLFWPVPAPAVLLPAWLFLVAVAGNRLAVSLYDNGVDAYGNTSW